MNMRRALIAGATALAVATAGSGSPAEATTTNCGRTKGTHYSFRVIAHGENAPSCRTARRVAHRAVGSQIDRPLRVAGWSCTADYWGYAFSPRCGISVYRGEGWPVTPGRQRKIAPASGSSARRSQSSQDVVM